MSPECVRGPGGLGLHTQFTYGRPVGLTVEPNLTWMSQRTPTDLANTIYQDPYALLGVRVHYTVSRVWVEAGRLTVFAEAENLADIAYVSSYLVRTQVPDPPPKPLTRSDVTTFIGGRYGGGGRLAVADGEAPVVVTATRAERQADEVSGSVSVIDHPTRACPLIVPDRADAETTASAPTSR